jgi:hypothetical protein
MPDEVIEQTNIKLKSKLTYEEKPIQVLEEKRRRVINRGEQADQICKIA